MEPVLIGIFVLFVALALIGGGYYLATHNHQLAVATATAITRATTIPSGDVAALNAKIDGLGSTLATVATTVGAKAADIAQSTASPPAP